MCKQVSDQAASEDQPDPGLFAWSLEKLLAFIKLVNAKFDP